MNLNYRLFVSDFDGTLVRSDGTVSQKNRDAIEKYRAAGGIFAVCTGRMLTSILPRLEDLGLRDGYVVAFQGAQIADIASGKLLRDCAFETSEALEVIRFMEEKNLHIHIYVEGKLFANKDDALLAAYERVCGVKGTVPNGLLSDMVASDHLRVVKVLAMQTPEERADVLALLTEKFGEKYAVACSSEWLVEVMPKGQTKAAAIAFLAEAYGIPRQAIAAIGDQENDIPMVMAAGGKFAVENAVPALKAIATVVPSFEEDGVAYAIEKYAMGEKV